MQSVRQFQQHCKHFATQLPSWLAPILLALLIGIGGVALWTQQRSTPVENELLWNGRHFTDGELSTVLKALSKAKLTQFAVIDRQIQVPRGMASRYLTAMADGQALPKDFQSNTDAALSSKSFFELERERQRQFNHAREKDMALAISAMDGIENAFVQYDESEARGLQSQREVTASVMVMTAEGHLLDTTEVATIRQAVAAAKIGMTPEHVAVTDLRSSRSWSGPLQPINETLRPQERLAIQQSIERHWQQKINRIVQNVPHAQAIVSVTLPHAAADESDLESSLVSAQKLTVLVEVPRSHLQKLALAKLAERKSAAANSEESTANGLSLTAADASDSTHRDATDLPSLPDTLEEVQTHVTRQLRKSLAAVLPSEVNIDSDVTIQIIDDRDTSTSEVAWLDTWHALRQKAQAHPRMLLAMLAVVSVGMVTSRIKRHRRRRTAPAVATIPLHSYRDVAVWSPEVAAVDDGEMDEADLRSALADLVREDPDSAARILNRWMERAS